MRPALGLFLLALSACAPLARSAPGELRVLVYNIHAGKDSRGADNLERVAAIVRETNADVVLLQEVDRGTTRSGNVDQVARLQALTGLHGSFGRTLDYQGGEYGIALLSRWRITSDTLVQLPVTPAQERSGGSHEPRGALWATIDVPGGMLQAINTHIDASRDDSYRKQEAVQLITLAASASRRGGSVLLGGDLNSEPASAVIALFTSAGLRDAWAECGEGEGLTFPETTPVKRIDYLMLPAGGVRCSAARVLPHDASDHRAVLFTLALPAR